MKPREPRLPRHSRLFGNQWSYPVAATNRRPRKTTDVETRREASRELLSREGQGRALSAALDWTAGRAELAHRKS
jgi:hypothetical protein